MIMGMHKELEALLAKASTLASRILDAQKESLKKNGVVEADEDLKSKAAGCIAEMDKAKAAIIAENAKEKLPTAGERVAAIVKGRSIVEGRAVRTFSLNGGKDCFVEIAPKYCRSRKRYGQVLAKYVFRNSNCNDEYAFAIERMECLFYSLSLAL